MRRFFIPAIISLLIAGCGSVDGQPESVVPESEPPQAAPVIQPAENEPENQPPEDGEPEEEPYPEYIWQYAPREYYADIDSKALGRFFDELGGVNIHGCIILQDGLIIDEYYNYTGGYHEDHLFRIRSSTKSIISILIGIAAEQGYISGVDAPVADFFPEPPPGWDDITIAHLLGNISGIYWREWNGGTMLRQMSTSENWVEFLLDLPVEHTPGTIFNYNTGGFHLLTAIIQEATGETAHSFAERNLFRPLGISNMEWRLDPQGISNGNGISLTVRDLAKLGQLYLDGGRLDDMQIVPEHWVEESTSRQSPGMPGTGTYGYGWWLRELSGHDVYYAMGARGQYIFVVPKLRLVTVMTSDLQDTYIPQRIFRDYLLPVFG